MFFKFRTESDTQLISTDCVAKISFLNVRGLINITLKSGETLTGNLIANNGSVVINASKVLETLQGKK